MSRAPGNSDDDLGITVEFEAVDAAPGEVMAAPIVLDLPAVLVEAAESSPEADDELLARDAAAASEAGETGRADALACARALLAERRGDHESAFALWRGAVERDPTLSIAFWGLRRALRRRQAWDELARVLDLRIATVLSAARAEGRADLWLERGRLLEDRLGRDDDAAQSYRAGLMEMGEHPALLTSLLLLGFRRGDREMTVEALSGLLRSPLPPALRAATSARLARLERTSAVASEVTGPATGSPVSLSAATSARTLAILRGALRAVGPDEAGPLLGELASLARVTADPATRVELLEELIAQHPVDATAGGAAASAAVPWLRERARLLRDSLSDPVAAAEALRAALERAPGHPLVLAELAELVEATASRQTGKQDEGRREGEVVTGLRELLALAAPGDRPCDTEAEKELAVRYLAALARAGQASQGLAFLQRHPELSLDRPDVFALEFVLQMGAQDVRGLAASFERWGERLAGAGGASAADATVAAHALVVAGTLREGAGGGSPPGGATSHLEGPAELELDAGRLYRRALELSPGYRPALAAVERRLWAQERWRDLVDLWHQRLASRGDGAADPDGTERVRVLEDLVAVHRDLLDDPVSARRYQDELLAFGDADARAWVRRHDLELAATARGAPSSTETRVRILRELAERAAAPAAAAALRVEAARLAMEGGDRGTAEALLNEAAGADTSGMAGSALERLVGGSDPAASAARRAAVVGAEIGRLVAALTARGGDGGDGGGADENGAVTRVRALRLRLAWHAVAGGQAREALAALEPLRAAGDEVAAAWSWDIARRSGDAGLALEILRGKSPSRDTAASAGDARLEAATDLGEALEGQKDFTGAAAAYRATIARQTSTDAALGLLRAGAALGNTGIVTEAAWELARLAPPSTAAALTREAQLLSLLQSTVKGESAGDAAAAPPRDDGGDGEDPAAVVLRWAGGVRGGDEVAAAAGLLAFGRAVPPGDASETAGDRNGLLARAAARARMGGVALAGAVHDQVQALSGGAAPVGVGLADLPVAGRPERIAARIARAERNGGALAYAFDIERALDAEGRGDARGALEGFARALSRDPEGIEALDGIKRLAAATGDRRGAARAGLRLGAVLRAPARAAAEFSMAGQRLEDLELQVEAAAAYWQALARDPESTWLYERLRHLLGAQADWSGLDQLISHRLAVLREPGERTALLLERAEHRLHQLEDRKAAIEDFKRILKIDPEHAGSLRHLATMATQLDHFPQAVRFLERLLALQTDEGQAAHLRLELAEAHEAAREPGRAVDVLRRAASTRPRDVAPWQRLTDLLLRMGDWSAALATLRSWDAVLSDPAAKAEIWVRVGSLLRDHGRDRAAAAEAFETATDLDPLGDGIFQLVALHERAGSGGARRHALLRAIASMRGSLMAEPLDVLRLRRLRELYEALARGGAPEAATENDADDNAVGSAGVAVVGQILALAGEDVDLSPPPRPNLHGRLSAEFWTHLRPPEAVGFAAEIWPSLAAAAAELVPPTHPKLPPRERVAPGSEPRLAWVEAAAAALGLPALELYLPKVGPGARAPLDTTVVALEGSPPGLLLGRALLAGDAGARFRVGRALGLLRDRAVVFERMGANELSALLTAAAVVAGAPAAGSAAAVKGLEEHARALARAMSRKDRRALELEASRFGFEAIDAAAFRQSVLTSADRLGLVLAGEVGVAVRIAGQFKDETSASPAPAAILANGRAVELIRFGLGEDYLMLRRPGGAGAEG